MPLTPAQQADIDRRRGMTIVPTRTSMEGPYSSQAGWNASIDRNRQRYEEMNRSNAAHQRLVNFGRMASMAPLGFAFAPGGVLAAGGSGAAGASASGWSMPGVTAPTFGAPAAGAATSALPAATAGSRIGAMFNSPGMNLGVNAGLSLLGMRSQNKANDHARADALAAQKQAIDLQLREIAERSRNSDLDRAEATRLNDRAHALELQRFALDKDSYDAREARMAPYRQRGQQALNRLAAMWSLG